MPDQKPMVGYAAIYGSVSAAETDLDAIEALHKDKVIGSFDAAIIDQENGKPHVAKRMDRPGVRIIPEWFGGGTLPRKELHELAGAPRQAMRTSRGLRLTRGYPQAGPARRGTGAGD